MANRIAVINQRSLTLTVNDIEHIESTSLNGVANIKIFFQPGANIATALSQATAMSQTQLRQLPPGTTPPLIIQYSASSVPILQLGLSGKGLSEQQLFDFGSNFIRVQLADVEGAAIPWPTEENCARCRWILIPRPCRKKAYRQPTLSPLSAMAT